VLIIAIDKFKKIKDNYGQQTGGKILKEFASFIKELSRNTDIIARY
jgi:diguanylate cyclase (GGDEF)-like protein